MTASYRWAPLALVALLAACASEPGPRFDPVGARGIDPIRAVEGPEAFRGDTVIWGGRIARIEARQDVTELEILGYPLDDSQQPDTAAPAGRRFIARLPGGLDAERYSRLRRVTVRGTLAGVVRASVGDYPYTYPVVRAADHELWPQPTTSRRGRAQPRIRFGVGIGIRLD